MKTKGAVKKKSHLLEVVALQRVLFSVMRATSSDRLAGRVIVNIVGVSVCLFVCSLMLVDSLSTRHF